MVRKNSLCVCRNSRVGVSLLVFFLVLFSFGGNGSFVSLLLFFFSLLCLLFEEIKVFWGFFAGFFSCFLFEARKSFNHLFYPNFSAGSARKRTKLGNHVL